MFKYAFIMNSKGLNPDIYSVAYKNDGFYCYVAAVHGMKMTREIAVKLSREGFEQIDLCGNYNEEKAEEIREATGDKVKINYVKYSESESKKIDALTSFKEYGIIIMADGMEDSREKLELKDEECNTYIAFVYSDEMAKEAAKELVDKGVYFIELCSYFDEEKSKMISEAIGYKVPVGYAG